MSIGSPAAAIASKGGLVPRFVARLHDAVPHPSTILFGSVLWGVLFAASAMIGGYRLNGLLVASPVSMTSLFFYGAALAFAPTLALSSFLFARRSTVSRILGGSLLAALITHTATAGIFALQYRVFYAHWHASFPSIVWFFQLGFTSAGAVFTFTVTSLHLYWPLSCLAFIGFGLWFARTHRPLPH